MKNANVPLLISLHYIQTPSKESLRKNKPYFLLNSVKAELLCGKLIRFCKIGLQNCILAHIFNKNLVIFFISEITLRNRAVNHPHIVSPIENTHYIGYISVLGTKLTYCIAGKNLNTGYNF